MRSTADVISASVMSARVRSGPKWARLTPGRRSNSTTGAEKHTATQPSTSTTARANHGGFCHRWPARYRCQLPVMRMWVRNVTPSANRMRRCLPTASTASTRVPGAGGRPTARGASKRTTSLPTSASRNRLAVRWIVSPSGTLGLRDGDGVQRGGPLHEVRGRAPARNAIGSSLSGQRDELVAVRHATRPLLLGECLVLEDAVELEAPCLGQQALAHRDETRMALAGSIEVALGDLGVIVREAGVGGGENAMRFEPVDDEREDGVPPRHERGAGGDRRLVGRVDARAAQLERERVGRGPGRRRDELVERLEKLPLMRGAGRLAVDLGR